MECLASIAGSLVGETAKCACTPVGRHFEYIFSYKTNIESFKDKLSSLKAELKSMQLRIDEARTRGEEIAEEVKEWISDVTKIISDAEQFRVDEENANITCSSWTLRHRGSSRAATITKSCQNNIEKAHSFAKISSRPILNYLLNKGFETFDTRTKTLKRVMKSLREKQMKRIGVCGMAGVGKTMFAKEVAAKAKEENLFSRVIFTTVSQADDDKNIERMQLELLGQLGMDLNTESTNAGRAARLRDQLRREEKILVILDDIWGALDLDNSIGISFEQSQSGCKILMTSRDRNVLSSDMEAEENLFSIDILKGKEPIDLFTKIVGNKMEESGFRNIGTKLIAECAGLPLAITTIANALKRQQLHYWDNALNQLKKSCWPEIIGINAKVAKSIMWSYDFLGERKEAKMMMLLCSLHGEDQEIKVEDLMRCGVGLDLIQNIDTFEDGRNRVRSLLDELKDRCLLLSGVNHDTVKMHDVIRDVIIAIPSKNAAMFNCADIERLAESDKIRSTAISVLGSRKLPQRLNCPKLELLLMLKANESQSISDEFFAEAKRLKVMYLTSVKMDSLSSCFASLQHIKILCFNNCKLGDLSLIGNLNKLEALDFSGSELKKFPKEIEQLSQLRLLSVANCPNLVVIPLRAVSSLKRIEEFHIGDAFIEWEINTGSDDEIRDTSVSARCLLKLRKLRLRIKDGGVFTHDTFHEGIEFEKLQWLTIQYLHESPKPNSSVLLFNKKVTFPRLEALKFSETSLTNLWPNQLPQAYFKTLKSLSVWKCNNLRHLLTWDVFQALSQIEYLIIKECQAMEEIVSINSDFEVGIPGKIMFPRLMVLQLWDLPKLERFWTGKYIECPSVKKTDIKGCPKLDTAMKFGS